MSEDPRHQQAQAEAEMIELGMNRFCNLIQQNESRHRDIQNPAGIAALKNCVEPVAKAIDAYLLAEGNRRGPKSVAGKFFAMIPSPELALVISVGLLNHV